MTEAKLLLVLIMKYGCIRIAKYYEFLTTTPITTPAIIQRSIIMVLLLGIIVRFYMVTMEYIYMTMQW